MARGPKIIDLTGMRFGKLSITGISRREKRNNGGPKLYWAYVCDCGVTGSATGSNLKRGITTSCGCAKANLLQTFGDRTRTHGMRQHPAYSTWCAIKARCGNPTNKRYADYGGRGISICPEWIDNFEAFWSDMGASWFEGATIERSDVNRNYEKSNCLWIPAAEQAKNKRNTRFIKTPDGPMRISEAVAKYGVPYEVLRVRYDAGQRGEILIRPSERPVRATENPTKER